MDSSDFSDEQVLVRLADVNPEHLAKQTVTLLRGMLERLAPGIGVKLTETGDAFLFDKACDLVRYAKTGEQCVVAECLVALEPMLAVYDTCGEFPFMSIGSPFGSVRKKAGKAIDVDLWRAAWRTVLHAVSAREALDDGGPIEIGELVSLSGVDASDIRKAVGDGNLELDATTKNECITSESALEWLLGLDVPGIQ